MSKTLRLGVVGLGNMGKAHARWIKNDIANTELCGVCDSHKDAVDKIAEELGTKAYHEPQDMFKSGDIDAVLISTPHFSHPEFTIAAFDAGLHVLVEKPVAVHMLDAQRMIDAHAKHPELKFGIMFQMRTDSIFKKVKSLIDSGKLGRIIRVNWIITTWYRTQSYYNSGTWRATWKGEGGGVLLNQCPHNLDLFQWFFGMPSKIRANCYFGKYHDIEVEDEVTSFMEYADGKTAVFITSTGEAPGTNRLEITADRGKLILEGGKLSFRRNVKPMIEFSNDPKSGGFAMPEVWDVEIPIGSPDATHQKLTENFADAILNGAELLVPGEEGIKSLELANTMLYSSMNNCEVSLPLDGAKYETLLKGLMKNSTGRKKVVAASSDDISKSFR